MFGQPLAEAIALESDSCWPEVTSLGMWGAPTMVIAISGGQKYCFWDVVVEKHRCGGFLCPMAGNKVSTNLGSQP